MLRIFRFSRKGLAQQSKKKTVKGLSVRAIKTWLVRLLIFNIVLLVLIVGMYRAPGFLGIEKKESLFGKMFPSLMAAGGSKVIVMTRQQDTCPPGFTDVTPTNTPDGAAGHRWMLAASVSNSGGSVATPTPTNGWNARFSGEDERGRHTHANSVTVTVRSFRKANTVTNNTDVNNGFCGSSKGQFVYNVDDPPGGGDDEDPKADCADIVSTNDPSVISAHGSVASLAEPLGDEVKDDGTASGNAYGNVTGGGSHMHAYIGVRLCEWTVQ